VFEEKNTRHYRLQLKEELTDSIIFWYEYSWHIWSPSRVCHSRKRMKRWS